jgi:uncharacterized protein YbjT (DUF2867 family)
VILVAGGTGVLGRRVVTRLAARGEEVRVLTRDRSRAEILPEAVQIVVGDLRSGPVEQYVEGASAIISAVHGFVGPTTRTGPESVDRDANARLVTAAGRAGVSQFVLVSAVGAAPDHPMSLHRMKYAAEQHLHRSGISSSTVRATSFLETWLAIIGTKLASGGPALVLGPGRNPINFVSADDVAAFVCLAADRDPRIAETVSVGGPQNLAFTHVAEHLLAGAHGSPGIRHIPLPALRAMSVLAKPIRPAFARQAHAAVVMNTTDMTFDARPVRERFPEIAVTSMATLTERAGSQAR